MRGKEEKRGGRWEEIQAERANKGNMRRKIKKEKEEARFGEDKKRREQKQVQDGETGRT